MFFCIQSSYGGECWRPLNKRSFSGPKKTNKKR